MKIFSISILLIFFASFLFGQINTNGLIGYWPFEGDADDASGNDYHGIVYGAVLGIDRFDNIDNSYVFNGIDDCIAIYYDEALNINESLTVSYWFKTVDPSPNSFSMPVAIAQTYGLRLFYTLFNKNSNVYDIMFRLFTNPDNLDSHYNNLNFYTLTKKCNCFDEKWHHFVGVYNHETENAYLYLDNELVDINPVGSFDFQINTVPITIGCYMKLDGSGFRGFYKGQIDDVLIYTRALDETEINTLYHYFPTQNALFKSVAPQIYPNPSNGDFLVVFPEYLLENQKHLLKIINSAGQILNTYTSLGDPINISLKNKLPQGLYFVQIIDENTGNVWTQKLLIND